MVTYNVLGRPVGRTEGPDKVTGSGKYGIDVLLPGTLWCKVLRSPYAHARVVRLDASRARALPGVHAVLTGEDVRGLRSGNMYRDEPVLASWDRVRFAGDRVAAVAAEDEDTAQRALDLLEVEYEELPAVFSAQEAAGPDAPLVHPEFNGYYRVTPLEHLTNVYARLHHETGAVEEGFAAADLIVERTYETQRTHQAYLEPHACLVWIDPEGQVQIWVASQAPSGVRNELSRLMKLPREQVVVNFSYLGGSFGGKGDAIGVPICYLLAKATGRPVKYVADYAEELMAMHPRHASSIRIAAGVKRDGALTAWQAEAYFATGAYAAYAPVPALGGLLVTEMVNAYRVPHVRIESHQVYTNTVPGGYYRGPGLVQGSFAAESHMDVVAREIGMDPFEFRLRNILRQGDEIAPRPGWRPVVDPTEPDYQEIRLEETLRTAAEAAGYFAPKPANVGRGIAVHQETQIGGDGHVAVHIHPDGQIVANLSTFDPGGGTYTILAQVVAEELGIPVQRVRVVPWSTAEGPTDFGVGGQRGARVYTLAGYTASQEAKQTLRRLAAEFLGWTEERIAFRDGQLVNEATSERAPLEQIAARTGGPITGRGDVNESMESPYASFATHIAEVSVDPETGQVRLLRYTAVHETGQVLNPVGFQGQVEGGVVQGVGQALMEELVMEGGRVANPSFADFKLPTARDLPESKTIILESASGHGPYKVRGIGDMPISLPAPAIANAIADACGVRIRDLPITAEKVYAALRAAAQGR